jgi:dihydrofolate synthase/folylpolyglutamate synthase
VISGVTEKDAADVIRLRAAELNAPLRQLGIDFDYCYAPPHSHDACIDDGTLDYIDHIGDGARSLPELPLALLGRHQAANASVAIAVVEYLGRNGFRVPESAIRNGLKNVRCRARVELVGRRPDVVVDAAHNVASAAALMETVSESFHPTRRILVFASSTGKDVQGMFRLLLPNFDQVVFTRYLNNPRALAPEALLTLANKTQATLESSPATAYDLCPDPAAAWETVKRSATADSLIVVTGSFFIASEMRHLVVGDLAALRQDSDTS